MSYNEKKGWLGRNWKWLLPTGCLSIIVIFVAFVATIIFVVFGLMKSSDVYQEALIKAKSNAVVVREFGEPIQAGWFVSGSITSEKDSGDANLKIPVSRSKKSGTINTIAFKKQGKWQFTILEVEIEGESKKINLLTSS